MIGKTTAVNLLSMVVQLSVVPPVPGAGVVVPDSDLEQAMATKATIIDRVNNFFMWSSFGGEMFVV
jgi:hypothetical protein